MLTCEGSVLIDAPHEVVYRMAEQYPTFVSRFREKRIVSQDEKQLIVQVSSSLLGIPIHWRGVGVKEPMRSITFTQTQGLLKGLLASWSFTPAHQGTEVKIRVQFAFPVPIFQVILEKVVGKVVKRNLRIILESLKVAAENSIITDNQARVEESR